MGFYLLNINSLIIKFKLEKFSPMKLKHISFILLAFFSAEVFADVSYRKLAKIKLAEPSEIEKNEEVQSNMMDMIEDGKFKDISNKAQTLLKSEEYDIDGKFKHTSYLDNFIGIVNRHRVVSSNYYSDNIKKAQEWIRVEPESPLGYIYYAFWVRQQAWSVRGKSYASDVSQNNMQFFADESIKNLNFLLENYDTASKDPFYYYILLMILRDIGLDDDYFKAYQDGVIKYPKQRMIYNTFMSNFVPKWFGENYDAVRMIIDNIQELNPNEKDFYYYHIMYTTNKNKYDLNKLKVDWNRVEQGAVDSLSKLASLEKIEHIRMLYCSYPGNKKRLEKLFNSFKANQLDENYIKNSLNSCQD